MKQEQNRVLLGYMRNFAGKIELHPLEAPLVRAIFQTYISCASLQQISDILYAKQIHSPNGKERWGRQAISNLLSNEKYMGNDYYPEIVSKEIFEQAQQEHEKRIVSNTEHKTRYSTKSPLSGLLRCEGCGRPYRRITRENGQVVWRCASRVESRSRSCTTSHTLKESEVLERIRLSFDLDERRFIHSGIMIREKISSIIVKPDGTLVLELK